MSLWSTIECKVYHDKNHGISVKKLVTQHFEGCEAIIKANQFEINDWKVYITVEVSVFVTDKEAFKLADSLYCELCTLFGSANVVDFGASVRWF